MLRFYRCIGLWVALALCCGCTGLLKLETKDPKPPLYKDYYKGSLETHLEWFKRGAKGGHTIDPLVTGRELEARRNALLEKATRSIYLATLYFAAGDDSDSMIETLCEKARAGLDVRLMYDAFFRRDSAVFGETHFSIEVEPLLRECGVLMMPFTIHRIPVNTMHEKFLVIDGEEYIAGGSNYWMPYSRHSINSERAPDLGEWAPWYDFDAHVKGPTACEWHKRFQWIWTENANNGFYTDLQDAEPQPKGDWEAYSYLDLGLKPSEYTDDHESLGMDRFSSCEEKYFAPEGDDGLAYGIYGNPFLLEGQTPILDAHLNAMERIARLISEDGVDPESLPVIVYAPYFVPHDRYIAKIESLLKLGVPITIFTNSENSNDEASATVMFTQTLERTARARGMGLNLMAWKPDRELVNVMHKKAGLYGDFLYFGSDNSDIKGVIGASESVIYTRNKKIKDVFFQQYLLDYREAETVGLEFTKAFNAKTPSILKLWGRWLRDEF